MRHQEEELNGAQRVGTPSRSREDGSKRSAKSLKVGTIGSFVGGNVHSEDGKGRLTCQCPQRRCVAGYVSVAGSLSYLVTDCLSNGDSCGGGDDRAVSGCGLANGGYVMGIRLFPDGYTNETKSKITLIFARFRSTIGEHVSTSSFEVGTLVSSQSFLLLNGLGSHLGP